MFVECLRGLHSANELIAECLRARNSVKSRIAVCRASELDKGLDFFDQCTLPTLGK